MRVTLVFNNFLQLSFLHAKTIIVGESLQTLSNYKGSLGNHWGFLDHEREGGVLIHSTRSISHLNNFMEDYELIDLSFQDRSNLTMSIETQSIFTTIPSLNKREKSMICYREMIDLGQ
ncbi:hypothetical protein CR513_10279, partial [Mucuna pruriens]